MARQYYKDSTTGQMKPLGVKVEDTLPVDTIVDYDGQDIPEGWVEVDDPNEYSTTEQVIGKWIDGKPLYRKVVTGTFLSNQDYTDIMSNIDKFLVVKGYLIEGSGVMRNLFYYSYYNQGNEDLDVVSNNGTLSYRARSVQIQGKEFAFVIEYTKTTD